MERTQQSRPKMRSLGLTRVVRYLSTFTSSFAPQKHRRVSFANYEKTEKQDRSIDDTHDPKDP